MIGSAEIIRADARHLPIADDSVDLCVSSPPYWSLRSYQDNGCHYDGQIGAEATPDAFVDSLIEVTRELVRVTKPGGSIWINLGDKYNAYNGRGEGTIQRNGIRQNAAKGNGLDVKAIRPKSLIGIPWRYALRCIDDLGLILRAEVIWSKPNGLPESVTDRVRRSHEQWFHFVREPRYFSAVDEIREQYDAKTAARYAAGYGSKREFAGAQLSKNTDYYVDGLTTNPLGKLPGSVWTVPTEPLKVPDHLGVDHFAAFPTEWPKRIIQGWSPSGVCVECGEGRRPIAEREAGGRERSTTAAKDPSWVAINRADWQENVTRIITGYACACPEPTAPTKPAVVLDPFGGTGTTAMVAKALGRHGISVDMSADYCRLAEWRTNDRDQLAKVLGIAKVDRQPEDQGDLLGLLGEESA